MSKVGLAKPGIVHQENLTRPQNLQVLVFRNVFSTKNLMGFHLKKSLDPDLRVLLKTKNGPTLVYTKLLSIPHAIHPKHGALVGAGSLWPSFEDCQAMKFTFLDFKCTLAESQRFFIGNFLSNFNLKKDFHRNLPKFARFFMISSSRSQTIYKDSVVFIRGKLG